MGNLSRLRIARGVVFLGLKATQIANGTDRDSRVNPECLQTGDERVATEHRHVPRNSSCWQPNVGTFIAIMKPEGSKIFDRLPVEPEDVFIRRRELRRALEPASLHRVERGLALFMVASMHRRANACSSHQRIQPARVPALPGSERDLEGDPAVRILRWRIAVREPKDQLALEVTIQVARLQLVPRGAPFLHDVTSANEPMLAHLEEIGEIGPQGDLEVERDRPEAVVGQVDVLVEPIAYRSGHDEREAPLRDLTIFGRDRRVGQVHARGEVRSDAGGQTVPAETVGENRIVAHVPSVVSEQASFAARAISPDRSVTMNVYA